MTTRRRPELRIVLPYEGKGWCEVVADSIEDERRLVEWLRAALRRRESLGDATAAWLDEYERRAAA